MNVICIHVVHWMELKYRDTLLHVRTVGMKGIAQMYKFKGYPSFS